MANSGVLRCSSATPTLGSFHFQQQSLSCSLPLPLTKVGFTVYTNERPMRSQLLTKQFFKTSNNTRSTKCSSQQSAGITELNPFPKPINQEKEGFLCNVINMSFSERLSLAWKILFPSATTRRNSNARIAKQRLKMILFSDRCAVSDDAKDKIVGNVVNALSDFVEIDSHEKVQLGVSTDEDLGTLYSITVPVRRVKPEFQEVEFQEVEFQGIASIEQNETSEKSES